ncbi:MAG: hypothetical protein ABI855_11490 [Bacteroidota bacterium]
MVITRNLPDSNISRNRALSRAKKKNDDTLAGDRFFTTDTTTRMNLIQPDYKAKMLVVDQKQAISINSTAKKNKALNKLSMMCSHFLQIFNFMVVEELATKGDRAFYGMSASSDAILPLLTEADVLDAADKIISGEAARTAIAGAVAVPFPLVADVAAQLTVFENLNTAQSAAADALDNAQEAVNALNIEADKVIKKVWDETETHFNEETIESKRANCREWGVIYISTKAFNVTGRLKVIATGLPPAAAEIVLVETGAKATYDPASGAFILKTGLTGNGTLHITSPALADKDVAITLSGSDLNVGEIGLA